MSRQCLPQYRVGDECGCRLVDTIVPLHRRCHVCKQIDQKRGQMNRLRRQRIESRLVGNDLDESTWLLRALDHDIKELQQQRTSHSQMSSAARRNASPSIANVNSNPDPANLVQTPILAQEFSLNAVTKLPRTHSSGVNQVHALTRELDVGETLRNHSPAMSPEKLATIRSHPAKNGSGRLRGELSERQKRIAKYPLRSLLATYYLLDAVARVTPDITNSCLDILSNEPPSRPLAESLASVYINTPRIWLRIRRMIRNYFTDILVAVSDILSNALVCTDKVLLHTESNPVLTPHEQGYIHPVLFDCIRGRRLIVNELQRQIQARIKYLTTGTQVTLIHPSYSHENSLQEYSTERRRKYVYRKHCRHAELGAGLLSIYGIRSMSTISDSLSSLTNL